MPSYQFKLNGQPIRGGAKVYGTSPAIISCVCDMPIGWFSINWNNGDDDKNNISSVKIAENEWRYEQTLPFGSYTVRAANSGTDDVRGGTEIVEIVFDYLATPSGPIPAIGIVGDSAVIDGKTIATTKGGTKGIEAIGKNVAIRNVSFADNGGYLIKVSGDNCSINNLNATTFYDYAIYAEGSRGLRVNNLTVIGGSVNESVLRFAGATDASVNTFTIDYRPVTTRKASIRGYGTGLKFTDGTIYGGGNGVVGLTPMSYDDGGSGLIRRGYLYVNQAPYLITVDNKAEWEAAVNAAIAAGKTQHADILVDVLNKVPIKWKNASGAVVTLPAILVDQAKTVAERIKQVGQRAESTFDNVNFIDAPIRNAAGGVQTFIGCKSTGELFSAWNENVYPPAESAMPKDEPRPFPVTTFINHAFESTTWDRRKLQKFIDTNRISVRNSTLNGKRLHYSGFIADDGTTATNIKQATECGIGDLQRIWCGVDAATGDLTDNGDIAQINAVRAAGLRVIPCFSYSKNPGVPIYPRKALDKIIAGVRRDGVVWEGFNEANKPYYFKDGNAKAAAELWSQIAGELKAAGFETGSITHAWQGADDLVTWFDEYAARGWLDNIDWIFGHNYPVINQPYWQSALTNGQQIDSAIDSIAVKYRKRSGITEYGGFAKDNAAELRALLPNLIKELRADIAATTDVSAYYILRETTDSAQYGLGLYTAGNVLTALGKAAQDAAGTKKN